jgi:hypothetical protein
MVVLLVAQTVAMLATAVAWSLPTVLGAGLVTGFVQTLGKLGLDAMIQRDVAEDVRASAFARSETSLQLAWVFGGGLGIALPLRGDVGFGIASGAMVVVSLLAIGRARERHRAPGHGPRIPAVPIDLPGPVQDSAPTPDRPRFGPAAPGDAVVVDPDDRPASAPGPFPPLAVPHPDRFGPPVPPAF